MPKERVVLDVFDGGRNTKASILNVPLHQTPDSQNIIYDDFGAFQTRNGRKTLNSTPIASSTIDALANHTPSSFTSGTLIAVCDGYANVITGTATAWNAIASSQTVWTAGVLVETVQFQDLLFFSNGGIKPYKFNGNEFTQAGVSATTVTLTAATNATAGNLNGSYTWVYTGVNSYSAEGDYGGVSATFAAVGESVVVGSIPTAPASHGIDHYNIYRNTAAVEGAYWYVTCVSNGVTSFTDDVADSSLTVKAPTDNGTPRFFKYMVEEQGRLWGAGDANKDFLWFSKVNQPEVFPSTNYIRIGRGDGLDISGLAKMSGVILVSKSDFNGRTAMYAVFLGDSAAASDPSNWFVKRLNTRQGAEAHRAMVPYSNVIMLVNRQGAFAFNGQDISLVPSETDGGNMAVDAISFEVEPDFTSLDKTLLKDTAGIQWKNKVWLSVPGSGASELDTVYQYDFVRMSNKGFNRKDGAWEKFTAHNISQFAVHEGKLYGGSSLSDGYVHELDSGTNDGGSAINSYFVTAPIKGKKGHDDLWKDFRYMEIVVETTGSFNLLESHAVDSDSFSSTQNISLAASGSETNKTVRVEINVSGRYLQEKFAINTVDHFFTVRKVTVYYNPRGLRN